MSKKISYDGIFKELLFEFPNENIVEFINNLFGKNYPCDSDVQKLETESHKDGKKKHSDMVLRVDGILYHAEIQSGDDKSMALRVFEYSYRAAMQHGRVQGDDCLRLHFPKSVVFYLRSSEKTPKVLTVELVLPDDNVVTFTTPTRHLKEYTLQDLTQRESVIFAPYYPMLFEGEPLKSREALENLKNEVLLLIDKIKEKADNGEIERKAADLIVKSLDEIFENVMIKSNVSKKEVDEIMEAVAQRYHLEPLNWREEGRIAGIAIGEEKGITKGKEEDATKMFSKGFSFEDIQDITGLRTETLEKIRKSIKIP